MWESKMKLKGQIEMWESLMESCNQAGGGLRSVEGLSKMTVLELIETLGPNKIRFHYDIMTRPNNDISPATFERQRELRSLVKKKSQRNKKI